MDYVIVFLLLVLIGGVIFLLSKKPKNDDKPLLMIQEQINHLREAIDLKLSESSRSFQNQFTQSTQIVKDVTEKLIKLEDTNKQVMGFAEQLDSLQRILTNPKQRGVLGEYYLETVLKNVLPPKSYQTQYEFDDGDIVDAVIFIKDKILPIDSKFSLENYNRIVLEENKIEREKLEKIFKIDLKKRIDETAKYIKPSKGTMDFAFMFIPSEGIYYDLLVNKVGAIKANTRDLIEYAFSDKHVIIVSPTSFHAYLQTVLQGLRMLNIEESAKEIRNNVEMLSKHLSSYEEYLTKIGNHLGTTVSMYNQSTKEWGKIDKDIARITEGPLSTKIEQIEKPTIE